MYLVGESKNLKDRIPKHLEQIRNGKANQKFAKAVNKDGLSNFEIILVSYGVGWVERSARLELERELLETLIELGLCYNSGVSETKKERPKGEFTTGPGIYRIRNTQDDVSYIGETSQRRGLNKRIFTWKQLLRDGTARNQKLQADWNSLGENAFAFEIVHSGPEWDDTAKRKAEETRLIKELLANGKRVYNFSEEEKKAPSCPLAGRETILQNQSAEYRQKMSEQNTGRPNLEGRKPIVINDNVYFSVMEAAEALNYGENRNPIKRGLKTGKYRLATAEEIAAEEKRRENGEGPVKVQRRRRSTTGYATPVLIDLPERNINNQYFASLSEAAKALGVSVQAISKALNDGRKGYKRITKTIDSGSDSESIEE